MLHLSDALITFGVTLAAPGIAAAVESAVDWCDRRAGREPVFDYIDDVEGREATR